MSFNKYLFFLVVLPLIICAVDRQKSDVQKLGSKQPINISKVLRANGIIQKDIKQVCLLSHYLDTQPVIQVITYDGREFIIRAYLDGNVYKVNEIKFMDSAPERYCIDPDSLSNL